MRASKCLSVRSFVHKKKIQVCGEIHLLSFPILFFIFQLYFLRFTNSLIYSYRDGAILAYHHIDFVSGE